MDLSLVNFVVIVKDGLQASGLSSSLTPFAYPSCLGSSRTSCLVLADCLPS